MNNFIVFEGICCSGKTTTTKLLSERIKELGYENIYLQGHSLGCTKIVYTYNELVDEEEYDVLSNIKGVILLSLIDIPKAIKVYLVDKFKEYVS